MDYLSKLLKRKYDAGIIGYHPKTRQIRITNLAFADDLMVFYDGKTSSLQGIINTLEDFYRLSGLQMNKEKTDLYVAGQSNTDREQTSGLGFRMGSFPFRYLGLPLLHRKLRKSEYSPLLDQVSGRFNHWTTKTLSFAGRLQLITSVIYSTVNFWMSSFLLPKGCLHIIESMCSKFLWAGDIARKGCVKVAWNQICLPKEEGGLGLRNFYTWNLTLNLRLVWIMFSSTTSLWVAWIRRYYLRHSIFWTHNPSPNSSWIWKSLLRLRPLAKRFIRSKVEDGKTVSYWHDNWTSQGPLIDLLGPQGPQLLGIPINAKVEEASDYSGWLLPSLRTRNPILSQLRSTLIEIDPPNTSRGHDTFTWETPNSTSLTYSAKQTWCHLRPSDHLKTWSKVIWYKGFIPKYAFTFWITHLDRLPIRSRLVNWGMNVPIHCCICGQAMETRDHLFITCDFSKAIWQNLLRRLGQPHLRITDWQSIIHWLATPNRPISATLRRLAVQISIFNIWKERNNRLHNNCTSSSNAIFAQIDRAVKDNILARLKRKRFRTLLSQWFTHD